MCGVYHNAAISFVSTISWYIPGYAPGSKSAKMARKQESLGDEKDGRLIETAGISETTEIMQALRLAGISINYSSFN